MANDQPLTSAVPDAPRGSRVPVWILAGALALTLGVDWLFPLRGVISYALATAISGLLLPWAALTLRFVSSSDEERQDPRKATLSRERVIRGLALRLALVLLAAAFSFAKWSVLLAAEGSNPLYADASRSYTTGLALLAGLGLAVRDLPASRFLANASLHPARLMALSFGGVGLAGTLLLSLPFSHRDVVQVSLIDNLFTAFSAVCVTGLTTVNLVETYSWAGQIVVLLLIQVGGLGIMVLSVAIAIMAGQKLRVRSSMVLTEVVEGASLATLKRTVLSICAVAFSLEALGALSLYEAWRGHSAPAPGGDGPGLWWDALFHAVSAFCNAGLSTYSEGLVRVAGQPISLSVMGLLVVLGGLGFPVLHELLGVLWQLLRRRRRKPLSLHARIVLRTSAALLAAMTAAYLVLEWTASLAPLGYVDRGFVAGFQAISARTAGFNAIDIAAMRPASWLLTCFAMFVGAAPSSTGGGIKVTTLVALFAGLRAELGATSPRLLNRTLADADVRKAVGVSLLSLTIVFGVLFLLLLLEEHPPLELAFEAVSAFSTTGLSTGITGRLTTPGKLLIALLMFAGRIGPLTLALAISAKPQPRAVKLPEERLMIG